MAPSGETDRLYQARWPWPDRWVVRAVSVGAMCPDCPHSGGGADM
jgi:hypothetical protein